MQTGNTGSYHYKVVELKRDSGQMTYIDYDEMKAQKYIIKTRKYLDYLEKHIDNVRRAFIEVSDACTGMTWVNDDAIWHQVRVDVILHDVSKLSAHEFTQYRSKFFPVDGEFSDEEAFDNAWNHHLENNSHHHESAKTYVDIVHMIIDWTAMSYSHYGSAQSYYEENKNQMNFSDKHINFMYEIFDRLKKAKIERQA